MWGASGAPHPWPPPTPPGFPRGLFKAARRRRHRRWFFGSSAVALAAAGAGFGAFATAPGGTAGLNPSYSAGPSSGAATSPQAQTTAFALASPSLTTLAFFDATSGYGLFRASSPTSQCQAEVARTSDGGATFASPVALGPCKAVGNGSIAFDDHGDGFVFDATSPDLYVTHDSGTTWSVSGQPGDVLSVEALVYSVWMLQSSCPHPTPVRQEPACRLRVRESADGGRSWQTSPAQPRGAPMASGTHDAQASFVRLDQAAAYVLGAPPTMGRRGSSAVPLWYTTDGGTNWSLRHVTCGMVATTARLAVAPTGTLFAACAGPPAAGGQMKSVVVSADGGASWKHPGGCTTGVAGQCTTAGLFGGYLGSVDAVSSTIAYLDEGQGHVEVTTDGAASFVPIGPGLVNAGAAAMAFFNDADGIVWAYSATAGTEALWHTDDGGLTWSTVTPVVAGASHSSPSGGGGAVAVGVSGRAVRAAPSLA